MRRILALTFATAALGLLDRAALAQTVPDCPYGDGYVNIAGSTAAGNIIIKVGAYLADAGTTVVYAGGGSCAGLDLIYSGTAPSKTSTVYTADGGFYSCNNLAGQVPTVVASDVFPMTCQNAGALTLSTTVPGSGFAEIDNGPWQAMLFVYPQGAAGAAAGIAAEQAYWVLGFGPGGGNISPWNQPNENDTSDAGFLYIRNFQSGTQEMISSYVYPQSALYASNWVGVNAGGSGGVVTSVSGARGLANASSVMGILALDAYGKNKTTLQSLPFRTYGQDVAWYPDSSQNANDRQNVRDGHYAMAGPVHFVAVGAGATPTDPGALAFFNVINGTTDLPGTDIVAVEASVFTVPDCAQLVSKTADGPGAAPYTPAHLCGCAFEHDVAATTSLVPYTCTACTCATGTSCTGAAGPCPAAQSICNYGFCEVQ